MVFPLDSKFVFGDNFFFLADNFFFTEGDKKNYSAKKKKIIHQQTNLLIQRKHHYTYDITFLCHPHPLFLGKSREKIWGYNFKHFIYREYIFTSKYFQHCFPEI